MLYYFVADSGGVKFVLFLGVAALVLVWAHLLVPSFAAYSYFHRVF